MTESVEFQPLHASYSSCGQRQFVNLVISKQLSSVNGELLKKTYLHIYQPSPTLREAIILAIKRYLLIIQQSQNNPRQKHVLLQSLLCESLVCPQIMKSHKL